MTESIKELCRYLKKIGVNFDALKNQMEERKF